VASLADLSNVFAQAQPAGFTLAGLGLQGDFAAEDAQVQSDRLGRNFGQRYLPQLLGAQGARGAYNSGATRRKTRELTQDTGDTLSDLASRGARAQAGLATNALLAQTGIQL
jgi:hypothetical protein